MTSARAILRKLWAGLKLIGRWLGPVLILLAAWLIIFPIGPWGNGADMPATAGAIIAAIAWFAGRKSGRGRVQKILAASALLGLAYWGWSSWEKRQGFTAQTVSFDNQGARLVGRLYLPERPAAKPSGKVPGIVFLSGSGALPASTFGGIATYFTRRGFAVLIYDKRGVGASTGIRESNGFLDVHRDMEALASDAAAGLSFLQSRPEVRSDATGFVGISEGGLIAPKAALLNGHAAFMLNLTSSTASLFEIIRFQSAPKERETKMAEAKAWFGKDFDPMPSLRALDVPGLWLGASWDPLVDNEATERQVAELRKLGKPYDYKLIPDSWHGLVIAPGKLSQETMDSWLARVTAEKR